MNYVIKCKKCTAHIHVLRKRHCCGIDYLELLQLEEDKKKATEKKMPQKNEKSQKKMIQKKRVQKKKSHRKGINKILREKVLKRDGYKCTSCESNKDLHLHHKIHRKHGGKDTEENLITLCLICHAKEHESEQVYNLMMKRVAGV